LADVVVVASVGTEAQTRLVSQTFLMKKAVVATTTGGLPEMISDGETGLLVEPGSAEAIANSVVSLARNPRRLQTLSEEAFRYAQEHFTFTSMMGQMLDTYTQAIVARNSG
jgi:glycosyltransferase involved in cell wall biosynthesis